MNALLLFLTSYGPMHVALGVVHIAMWRAFRAARRARVVFPCALAVALLLVLVDYLVRPYTFRLAGEGTNLLFLHAPLVLLALAWHGRHRRWPSRLALTLACVLIGVGVDAFLYEPCALRIQQHRAPAPFSLHVAVMSDFQAMEIGAYERDVLAQLGALNADLVLLAGDYLQVPGGNRAEVVTAFRAVWQSANIHPRLGVYAVRGDQEGSDWESELFAGLDVHTSDKTVAVEAGPVHLNMLSLYDSTDPDFRMPSPTRGWQITLGHRPEFAMGHGPPGLFVAGHTHGGQVQIPFYGPPIIFSLVSRAWGAGGMHVVDAERQVLVTRGAGVEHNTDSPPLRFNCRPEIVELTLEPRE